VGRHSYEGLAALDQLLAAFNSLDQAEKETAFRYARMYLYLLCTEKPDSEVRLVFQALQLLAEKESKDDPPRIRGQDDRPQQP